MLIKKGEFAEKLKKVRSATGQKNLPPAQQGVLVAGDQITAHNLKIGITAKISAELKNPIILMPKAMDFIAALPETTIEITTKGEAVEIFADGIESTFRSDDAKNFSIPAEPTGESNGSKISISTLQDLVSSVMYAVATNETRPTATGVLLEATGGELNVVALDGFRLAWSKVDFDDEFSFVVPKETLEKLLKLGIEGEIEINYTDKNMVFKTEDYAIYTILLQGEFFNYQNAVPCEGNIVSVDRKTMLDCVERAQICMDDLTKSPVTISFSGGKMVVSLESATAQFKEEVEVDGDIDESLRIGFNIRYLRDSLKAHKSEIVTITYNTATTPIVMKDNQLTSMILPVRLHPEASR